MKLNIANPDTTAAGSPTIAYDANGNRTSFAPYGTTNTYAVNNLNEYTTRNSIPAAYNTNADLTTGFDGSTYTYDAQDRLLSATKSGVTETFKYDGLNRQVSRTVNGATTYNVYDGWDLIEEYQAGGNVTAAYLHGVGGLVKNLITNNYYYQDGSGSTSHLADNTGHLLEWYRYDLQGTPVFYNFANTQQSASAYSIRHLFTGQQWYSELGLYDLRNRFYSPDIGRFLQADPSGFNGDATNLYRYCGNNPLKYSDPSGEFRYLNIQPSGKTTNVTLILPINYSTGSGVPTNAGETYISAINNSAWSTSFEADGRTFNVQTIAYYEYNGPTNFVSIYSASSCASCGDYPSTTIGRIDTADVLYTSGEQLTSTAIWQAGVLMGDGTGGPSAEALLQIISGLPLLGQADSPPDDDSSTRTLPAVVVSARPPGVRGDPGFKWGPSGGFPTATGGVLGPGGIAAIGPDAVFGATFGPGILGELGLGGGGGWPQIKDL